MSASEPLRPYDPVRRVGSITTVFPDSVLINLDGESQTAGRILDGNSFGGGGVGDFVIVDCDELAVFARVMEVRLPTSERLDLEPHLEKALTPLPIAKLHLLGVLDLNKNKVIGGVTCSSGRSNVLPSSRHSRKVTSPPWNSDYAAYGPH